MSTATPQSWNANRVTARFVVGAGITGPDEMHWLTQVEGVTHVISAAAELDDETLCVPDHVYFDHIKWLDDGQPKPEEDFAHALEFVMGSDEHLWAFPDAQHGGRLPTYYIHCAAGVNRGPMLATFLLAALSGLPAMDAFALVRAKRPVAQALNNAVYRQSVEVALAAVWQAEPRTHPAGAPSLL